MSQHDLDVANQGFSAYRTDMNAALVALGTLQSGASAPATTFAYMLWADTTANLLKRRNAANSGWIVVRSLSETFVVSRSSDTILAGSDVGKMFMATAAFTQTLTAAATLGDGWFCAYNAGGFSVVLDPNSSETIDGATTKTVTGSGFIYCNGSAFFTVGFPTVVAASPITNSLGADVALNNTANYFDGPSIAQGTSGTWFVSGTVTLNNTGTAGAFLVKLWDGTTVIASASVDGSAAGFKTSCSLSGYIASPAGNLRMTVKDQGGTSGKIVFNASGNSKDSTITAIRIA